MINTITFMLKSLTKITLYIGKPIRYRGAKVGEIIASEIKDNKVYITARITNKLIMKEIVKGQITSVGDLTLEGETKKYKQKGN